MKQTVLYKKELEYFFVEESYGGNQDLFPDVTMRDEDAVQSQPVRAVFILQEQMI